ncbi:hypothetical protein GCM10009665_41740 [Kitasatospora nipponensis]|uniref:Integral membrane bound transporter domain-containing protein n=1 Tax=Kitasatospora nipponensis TaxID=258049 RepID=A0ABN1WH17_9ACTN
MLVTTVLVQLLHPGEWLSAMLAVACICGAYLTNRTGFALMTACVSSYVVPLLGLQPGNPFTTAVERVGLTLVGGTVALLVYALFPSSESPRLGDRLADWIAATGRYATAVLTLHGDPAGHSSREVRTALLDSRQTRAEFLRAMQQAEAEPAPESLRSLSGEQSARARAAVGLLSRAALLLEAHLPAPQAPPLAGAEEFAAALLDATSTAATAVRLGTPVDFSRLRAEQQAWEGQLSGLRGERPRVVAAALRLLLKALDDLEVALSPDPVPPALEIGTAA